MELWIKVIIVLVIMEVGLTIIFIHGADKSDIACQEIGFESAKYIDGMEYCEDKDGNLYYAQIECKPWYWISCTAKEISVGDVRVR